MSGVVDLSAAFERFDDRWSPKIVATVNDFDVKVAKVEGTFVAHVHDDTDELFLVHRGRLRIELPDETVELGPGDLFVIPAGVEHRPIADELYEILLLEPRGTPNTGDATGTVGEAL
jgi:mannose-6-phosphate isomerase-like protein (cupin superfamily)